MGNLTANLTGSGYLVPDLGSSTTVQVASSRALTQADSGKVLECTAGSITLTMPAGLSNFGCSVIPISSSTRIRSMPPSNRSACKH